MGVALRDEAELRLGRKGARIALVLRAIPHYRIPLLDQLRVLLLAHGINLTVVYGQVGERRGSKGDTVDLAWGERIQNRVLEVGGLDLYWQPCINQVRDADLVIVTQEARLLVNYLLHWHRARGELRLAYWGHGGTYQRSALGAFIQPTKAWLAKHVDWWFGYTSRSASSLAQMGVPASRVTIVNNAIDTASLAAARASLTPDDLQCEIDRLGLRGRNVGVYIGGMYREKRLDFLLAACKETRARISDFECVFIGDGPQAGKVRDAAASFPWIRHLGGRFGAEKVLSLSIGKVMLMPGLVGLALLDSFALQLPMVTTDLPYHSPEIAYLENGENGILLPGNCRPEEYGTEIAALLMDERRLAALKAGCREAADEYTIEKMAARFAAGVVQALQSIYPGGGGPWALEARTGSSLAVSDQ